MPADKAFTARLNRIETGTQWAPEGVIHMTRATLEAEARRRARRRGVAKMVLMAALVPVVAIYGQPYVPEPIVGFFTASTTDAAMASLGQLPLFSGLAAR